MSSLARDTGSNYRDETAEVDVASPSRSPSLTSFGFGVFRLCWDRSGVLTRTLSIARYSTAFDRGLAPPTIPRRWCVPIDAEEQQGANTSVSLPDCFEISTSTEPKISRDLPCPPPPASFPAFSRFVHALRVSRFKHDSVAKGSYM